ncbi:hypothetical protein [Macrococcus animalis]|uniref:hypothetical protein n=1 Tax=Macrococcus animalis TaxID=3395467 RepID=UPI0039BDD5F7
MKKEILPTVARAGMTQAFYTGVLEGYKDVLNEIEDMKDTFDGNEKEMFVLKSLERTILLQSKNETEKMHKGMSRFRILPKKRSIFNRLLLFNHKKA